MSITSFTRHKPHSTATAGTTATNESSRPPFAAALLVHGGGERPIAPYHAVFKFAENDLKCWEIFSFHLPLHGPKTPTADEKRLIAALGRTSPAEDPQVLCASYLDCAWNAVAPIFRELASSSEEEDASSHQRPTQREQHTQHPAGHGEVKRSEAAQSAESAGANAAAGATSIVSSSGTTSDPQNRSIFVFAFSMGAFTMSALYPRLQAAFPSVRILLVACGIGVDVPAHVAAFIDRFWSAESFKDKMVALQKVHAAEKILPMIRLINVLTGHVGAPLLFSFQVRRNLLLQQQQQQQQQQHGQAEKQQQQQQQQQGQTEKQQQQQQQQQQQGQTEKQQQQQQRPAAAPHSQFFLVLGDRDEPFPLRECLVEPLERDFPREPRKTKTSSSSSHDNNNNNNNSKINSNGSHQSARSDSKDYSTDRPQGTQGLHQQPDPQHQQRQQPKQWQHSEALSPHLTTTTALLANVDPHVSARIRVVQNAGHFDYFSPERWLGIRTLLLSDILPKFFFSSNATASSYSATSSADAAAAAAAEAGHAVGRGRSKL